MKCNSKTANIIYLCVGKITFLYVRLITFLLIYGILRVHVEKMVELFGFFFLKVLSVCSVSVYCFCCNDIILSIYLFLRK